jgi:hypothetical protein
MKKILDASRLFEVLNRFRAGYPKQPWAEMGNGAGVPRDQNWSFCFRVEIDEERYLIPDKSR